MRIAAYLLAITCSLPLALPLACGGGTPSPKGEDEANSEGEKSDESKGDKASAAPEGSGDKAAADAPPADSAAAPAAAAAAAPPASGGDSSGDIKAPKDDTFMAAHQIPDGDVNKTVKGHKGQFQACYKKGKKKDPATSGEVKVKFVISNDGKVKDWKDDSSSMSNEDVTKCVGEVIRKLKFPKQKSPGDAWGTYSINFNP